MHDAIIIGAGFYGCSIASSLRSKGLSVLVLEREAGPMRRASLANQARVHGGYHYPRDYTTAWRSAESMERFVGRYRKAVTGDFTQLYAIASRGSQVSAGQFGSIMRSIGAPLKAASHRHLSLFSRNLVDSVHEVEEYAFDAVILAEMVVQEALEAGVEFRFGVDVLALHEHENRVTVMTSEAEETAARVFNCTYGRLHTLHPSPLERTLRYQVCEICLITPPPILENVGITIMDGPFWSCMPWPSRALHSLTHVRHTPRTSWTAQERPSIDPYAAVEDEKKGGSAFAAMISDARRFVPAMADSTYVESVWEAKAILANGSGDARPILLERSRGGRIRSVLGGKLDNVFDVLEAMDTPDGENGA